MAVDLLNRIGLWLINDVRGTTVLSIAVLLVIVRTWVWTRSRRRSLQLFESLASSSRGTLHPNWGPNSDGFFVTVQPAPEPFEKTSALLHVSSIFDPLHFVWAIRHRRKNSRRNSLLIRCELVSPPNAELVWIRGTPPARALGTGVGRTLWVHHRLDFVNTEFATRGYSTEALRYVFTDMQRRFNPVLQRVSIQRDKIPQIEILADISHLNAEEIPALVTTIRAVGKAALQG